MHMRAAATAALLGLAFGCSKEEYSVRRVHSSGTIPAVALLTARNLLLASELDIPRDSPL